MDVTSPELTGLDRKERLVRLCEPAVVWHHFKLRKVSFLRSFVESTVVVDDARRPLSGVPAARRRGRRESRRRFPAAHADRAAL